MYPAHKTVEYFNFITARKRSLRRLCFYHLSVSHSVHRGAGVAGEVCMAGGHAWQGACMAGGAHGGGHACHTPSSPPGHYEIRSVNARAVRILLECILMFLDVSNHVS